MREREKVRRYLALLLAFAMIFTSSSMNVLAATIVGGYKNSDKSQTTVEESETTVETEVQETEASETDEDGTEIRKNVVTFSINGHAHVVVDGTTVESTAYAKDGKIVFDVAVENGYQIESVLVDKSINARTTENGSYIIEGIQTDNTTVDITTVEVETEAQTETSTETETESESESESETESETKLSEESEISKPAQKLTITAADGARITVNAPEGALPEGSSVNAIVIESRAIETILENTIEAEGKELNNYKAYDITIIGPDGAVIQPDDSVKVSIRNAGVDGEENAVYHVDGASANKIADIANGNSASFETDHFSIYVITGENTPAIATYEFYDGTNLISSQSVKNGESLVEPAAPEHDGQYFTGWFIEGTSTPVAFSTPVSVSETGTVKVVAEYEDAYYVFFKNSSGIVICTKKGKTGDVISTSDVTFPVSGTQGITGWYEDEGLTKKVETVTLRDEDVVLYPKVENGYYITYQSNGGSYTAPVFILPTENTTAPNIPAKPGYTFKYWSLTENGSEYRFGEKLTANITLYAVWEAKDTNYLIMYWMENANYENSYLAADKRDMEQYSYAAAVTGRGKTGEETNVSGWNGKVPAGFTLQSIKQQTIAGDGSTVVNVYINRNTYDVKFMYDRWNENTSLRITAKYGANIESEWPGYNWRTSYGGSTYQTHLFTMPAGGAKFYEVSNSAKTSSAGYYVEVLPGETGTITKNGKQYKLHHTDQSYGSGYTVTDEDRYNIEGYTCNTSLSPRNGTSWDGTKFYYNRNQYDIIFINEGTKADQISKYFEQSLTGVSCSKELTPPAGKESYVFAGWYDNPEGEGNQYTFTGRIMPAKNVTVYAKWVAPTFNITVYSTIDASDEPNVYEKVLGSKLSSDELSVTTPDGHTFRGWYLYENGQRTSLYNPDTEIRGDIALVPYWTSDETFKVSYEAGTGTGTVKDEFEYTEDAQAEVKSAASLTAPDADSYFQGWLSDTDNRVYYPGDVYLMKGDVTFTAQWGKEEKTTVFYQPGIGKGTSQSFDAANNAEIVTKTPEELEFTAPDGYTFTGWSYTNSDGKPAVADAGAVLHVDTKTTPGNTLTAQWAKLSAVGGTWTYDGQSHTVSNVSVEGVDGYTVTYKVDGDGTEYTDVTSVAISSVGEKNVTVIARKTGYRQLEKTVTLKITPIEVTVSVIGNNDNRVYNGSAQSVNGYSISSDNTLYSVTDMVNGPTQENAIASRKDVGTTYMGLSKDSFTNVNTNFNVTFAVTDGYITITAQSIVPDDPSYRGVTVDDPRDHEYDAQEHKWTPTVTDKEGNTLTEGTDYKVSYDTDNFVDVKTITVTITGEGGYSGTVIKTYEITPKAVTILTYTDSKVYDGKALTANGEVNGLAEGETVGFVTTGSQTYVGSSDNTYEITWAQEEVEEQAFDEESAPYTAKRSNYTVSETIGTLTVTDGAEEEPVEPNLVVKKNDEQADGYQYKLGETVSFVISVTNIYDEAKDVTITELTGVIIEGADAGTPNVLVKTNVAPGETVTATASYTITEEDIANGFFRNIVKAAFDGGKTFENEKTVDTEEADRSYSLNKTARESAHESGMFKVGETIHYTITAVNTGNQTIKNFQIEDTLKAAGTISNITADGVTYIQNGTTTIFTITELPAKAYNAEKAESVVIEYDYLVQEADKGNVISNAIIGRDPEDPEKPGEGGGTENTVEDPKLEVTKNVTSIVAQDGTVKDITGKASLHDMITYQVTVKNTGNIRLMNVKLADSLEGIVLAENDSFDIGTLDVGEEKKVTYTYAVKEADLGSVIVNVATATGDVPEDPEDTPKPSGKDEKEVPTDEKSSAIQVTKTVISKGSTITVDGKETTGYRVGDTIEFNIHVENIGNITVNNIVVNDVPTLSAGSPNGQITIQAGDGYTVNESTATIATLAPKASVDIKASYLVIAGDGTLNGNELSNAVFATGTSEDPNNPQPGDSSKTDPVPIEPEPGGHAEMQGSITVTKMITTSANKTPENGVDAVIKVGLYDNASFSGTPIAVNTITISKATSGSTVFDELDNTSNTTYYVAELDANNNPIIGASAHLDGYGVPSYSENCKNGINPTTATDTGATIVNPLAADDNQDETEETEETEVTTETEKETSSTTKPSGGSNTSGSAKSSTAAKTGDDTNMMVYWILLGMAALAGCTAVVYRKKKRNQ